MLVRKYGLGISIDVKLLISLIQFSHWSLCSLGTSSSQLKFHDFCFNCKRVSVTTFIYSGVSGICECYCLKWGCITLLVWCLEKYQFYPFITLVFEFFLDMYESRFKYSAFPSTTLYFTGSVIFKGVFLCVLYRTNIAPCAVSFPQLPSVCTLFYLFSCVPACVLFLTNIGYLVLCQSRG